MARSSSAPPGSRSRANLSARQNRVAVIGTWHLASVLAAGLASLGHQVIGVWHDSKQIDRLSAGRPPVYEPGLAALLRMQLRSGRLTYTADYRALHGVASVFVALDTTVNPRGVDLTNFWDTIDRVRSHLSRGSYLVISSQVPVGTCRQIAERVSASRRGISVVYQPEFLRLGSALRWFRRPTVVIVGSDGARAATRVGNLYQGLRRPVLRMGLEEAELVKHAANAFGATSISFANELARVCEIVGADAFVVTQALRFDGRVGPGAYIRPGGGFSGATLERDLRVLRALARRGGLKTALLDAVLSVNSREEHRPMEFLRTALGSLRDRKVGLLGLTYKPGTSTLRGAYSLKLARALAKEGTVVRGIDPRADPFDRQLPPELKLLGDVFAIASGADALVLVTPWSEYLRLPWRRLRTLMRRPVLIDLPNALDGAVVRRAGFKYFAPGRPRNLRMNTP